MKLESRDLRYCLSIACDELEKGECKVQKCKKEDRKAAIEERIAKLKEVKHGGNA